MTCRLKIPPWLALFTQGGSGSRAKLQEKKSSLVSPPSALLRLLRPVSSISSPTRFLDVSHPVSLVSSSLTLASRVCVRSCNCALAALSSLLDASKAASLSETWAWVVALASVGLLGGTADIVIECDRFEAGVVCVSRGPSKINLGTYLAASAMKLAGRKR